MDYSDNVLVGLPPGGGKTVLAELFVLSFLLQEALREESKDAGQHRVFYVTSNEDVVERRGLSWRMKFEEGLQQQVAHLTRAASVSQPETHRLLRSAPIVVVSAAALVNLVRREDPILRSMTHLIVDHLHLLRSAEGRFLEECIASLNSEPFLANGGTARPRLLGLTYPLITTNELGRWLAVPAAQRFNYGNSYRALQVRMETVDLPGARAREETALLSTLRYLQRPAYAAVPAVCFVPTADLAVRFARRVLLQCRDFIPEVPLNHDVEDEQLALFLAAGVAYLHHGTSLFDTLSVLELLDEPAVHPTSKASLPLILVCTYDVAGRLPAAAFVHGFLCPERPTGGLSEEEDGSREVAVVTSSDCTVSETLQMTSRVMQACLLYVRPTRRFMWSNLLNEPLPLESYLRYPSDFRETVNAAVARGVVENRTDVLRVLRAHYFLYHLQSNPNFYGVASLSAGEVGLFASEFADHVTALLEADGCVEVHGGSEDPHAALTSTRRGRAVAHHCIATDSVVQLAERLASLSAPDLTTLWECLTLSSEELAPRNVGEAAKVTDPAEGRALQTLVRCLATLPAVGRLAAHFDKLGEHLKLFALLLAYGTRVLPGMLHYEQTVLQRQEKLQQSPAYSEGNTVQVHPFELAEGIPAAERKLLCDIPLPIALRFTRAVEELLPLVVRVVAAAVETLDGAEHGSAVLSFMRLHQSFYQQRWYADPTAIPPSPSSPRVTDLTVQTAVHTKYEREVLTLSVAATIQHPSATPSGEEESVDHTPYEWWLACWAQAKQKKDSPACLMALRAQEMTPADGTIEDDNHQNNNENWNLRGDLFFPISALKTCTGETDLDAVSITVEIIHKTTPTTHKKIVF
ncbi:ATP-dependent RNA helicase [Angomonas deanei]|uniref:DEAD/DEAH box helicase, putative n=1 Tax=Angomonas deanei TaxID=59799 RepID=A0A7G2CP89_9TRYP|nr:ATP-dependent RNA helicase [Angomonas deanei]CAD2221668.1 DEAD/DEAH box helicase, putative [Angomonas deanei]|eukprot:EPY19040.1 ATP-dependent RNA helicase [Angomonas deanei]